MKTKLRIVGWIVLLALSTFNLQLSTAHAQGTAFTYQGRLNSGANPAGGIYDLRFTIYDAVGGGSASGVLTNAATPVTNGLFTVTLDFGAGVFTGAERWLEIGVRTNGASDFDTLTARQALTPTPYAIFANTASNLLGTLSASQLNGSLPATQLSGTLPAGLLPAMVLTNNQVTATFSNITIKGSLDFPTAGMISYGGIPVFFVIESQKNTFVGNNSGNRTATGNNNTGFGSQTLPSLAGGAANTAGGAYALYGNTSGSENTAMGMFALGFNGAGSYNTAVGSSALSSSQNASNNIALGYFAGHNLNYGNSNIYIGHPGNWSEDNVIRIGTDQSSAFIAGQIYGNGGGLTNLPSSSLVGGFDTIRINLPYLLVYNTIGSFVYGDQNNLFLGMDAGYFYTNSFGERKSYGNGNTAVGNWSLASNTNGGANTAVGGDALRSNVSGSENTAVGCAALVLNTNGMMNSAFGANALMHNANGVQNTAIGRHSLYGNTTGRGNVAVGAETLFANTIGSGNTAVGIGSLYGLTLGSNNVAVGNNAMSANQVGSCNIAIGYQAGANNNIAAENNIHIGNLGSIYDYGVIRIGDVQTATYLAGVINGDGSGLVNLRASTLVGSVTNWTLTGNLYLPAARDTNAGIIYCGEYPLLYADGRPDGNIYLGLNAGNPAMSGSWNTVVGNNALFNNTGNGNTANGYQALHDNTDGSDNTANGAMALFSNTNGFNNSAYGYQSLFGNTSGSGNTAQGFLALAFNTSGQENTAVGAQALYRDGGSGSANTAVGKEALAGLINGGNNNIALGYKAGIGLITGSSNIYIGHPGDIFENNLIRIGDRQTQAMIAGVITGNGGGLTNINAARLTGIVPLANLSGITFNQMDAMTWQQATNLNGGYAALATNLVPGISITNAFITNAVFAGDGGGLTNLNASQLTSGTVPLARIPAAVVTNNQSGVALGGTFTGSLSGNASTATTAGSFTGSLSGDVTGTQSATVVVSVGGQTAANVASGASAANAATSGNTAGAIVKRDASGNFFAGTITAHLAGNAATASLASNVIPGIAITNAFITSSIFAGNGAGITNVDLLTVEDHGAIQWGTNWGAFTTASSPGVGSAPASVITADVNGDDRVDLICANYGDSTLTVLTNNGIGGFVTYSSPGVGFTPRSVTAADVNGDGKVDLISANMWVNTLTVLTNNGSGGFAVASSPDVGNAPDSVTAADVNGDGKMDLISANYNGSTLTVLTNNGSGGFDIASSPGVGSHPFSVTAADVNSDGKVDLICANSGDNTLTVLTNNGSGGFAVASLPGVGSYPYSVTAADINGDGKVDLICANSGDNTLTVLTNKGSGDFATSSSPGVGNSPYSVMAAEVNDDGKVDLICANRDNNTLTVLFNSAASYTSIFNGNGSGLTSLNTASLTGIVPLANLSGIASNQLDASTWQLATNLNGGRAALATNVVSGILITNAFITNSVFAGNGAGLTSLNAAQLTGIVPLANLSGITGSQLDATAWLLATNLNGGRATLATNVVSGISITNAFITNSVFAGDGGGLTNLNSTQLTGTVPLANLSGITGSQLDAAAWQLATNLNGGRAALATNVVSGIAITNAFITNSVFAGNGSGLTNLNASQLTSGTVPLAQIPSAVVTNNQAGLNLSGIFAGNGGGLTNLNSTQLTGTVPLANLSGITSSQLDAAAWQLATNLNGGRAALATNVVSGISITNAFITNSVFAGNGSGLTNLNASQLTSGTVPLAQIPSAVVTNNQAGLNLSGNFAGNGGGLTNLSSTQLTGTVPLANLSGITSNQLDAATWQLATNLNGGRATLATNVVSGISITNAFITNSVFAGNGGGLTNLNASQLSSGTVADARLSANVPLLNGSQTFSSPNTFNGAVTLGSTLRLLDKPIYFRVGTDLAHGLGWCSSGSFGGYNPDGPVLWGNGGGGLGTVNTSTNLALVWNSSGRVGIGRTPSANALEVSGNASKDVAGSWLANSDARIKTDIATVTNALETLARVRPVSFRYTETYRAAHPGIKDRAYLNVVAQEFQQVFPDAVQSSGEYLPDGSEILQVDTYPLTIYSAAAVQELGQKLEEKDVEIQDLKARLERLEQLVIAKNGGGK